MFSVARWPMLFYLVGANEFSRAGFVKPYLAVLLQALASSVPFCSIFGAAPCQIVLRTMSLANKMKVWVASCRNFSKSGAQPTGSRQRGVSLFVTFPIFLSAKKFSSHSSFALRSRVHYSVCVVTSIRLFFSRVRYLKHLQAVIIFWKIITCSYHFP